jgi:hypothetical protein
LLKNKVIVKPEKKVLRTYAPMGYINRYTPCKNKKTFNEVFSEINAKTCVQ